MTGASNRLGHDDAEDNIWYFTVGMLTSRLLPTAAFYGLKSSTPWPHETALAGPMH